MATADHEERVTLILDGREGRILWRLLGNHITGSGPRDTLSAIFRALDLAFDEDTDCSPLETDKNYSLSLKGD